MAMQPCRSALARSRQTLRLPALRACYYSTDTTVPESFKPSESPAEQLPRWAYTPPAAKAPTQIDRAKDKNNKIWPVNANPEVLDRMYNRLLGDGGSQMLPEELKWLAVTHKSFDNGRRGFSDRLALLGRMAYYMEATKWVVGKGPKAKVQKDEFSELRKPFENEQLAVVDNLSVETIPGKEKLYALAAEVGMLSTLRWKPRMPNKLEASGVETVMTMSILAIIGAISLQHGSVVASKVVREKLLPRLENL